MLLYMCALLNARYTRAKILKLKALLSHGATLNCYRPWGLSVENTQRIIYFQYFDGRLISLFTTTMKSSLGVVSLPWCLNNIMLQGADFLHVFSEQQLTASLSWFSCKTPPCPNCTIFSENFVNSLSSLKPRQFRTHCWHVRAQAS